MTSRPLLLAVSVLLVGCGGTAPVVSDGGGETDAGSTTPDGGSVVQDAGTRVDAGTPDAGAPDAGTRAPAAVGCVTDVSAGHHSFGCEGLTYEVEVSAACALGGCGVVLDVHGATMSAASQNKSTKLRSLAPPLGYVVVQPSAASLLGVVSWTPSLDDPKVWAFLTALREAMVINPKKVHVTGFSQGGAMTFRFLCAHADELASVAPVAAGDGQSLPLALDCSFSGAGAPSQQVPVLHMHGTLDTLVNVTKGQQQRDAAIAGWGLGSPTVLSTSAGFTRTRYASATGTVYEYLEHSYSVEFQFAVLGGHCLPGGDDLIANGDLGQTMFFSCAAPVAFTWGEQVMAFFVAHPRP